jgi:hypothetical protein
MGMDSVSDPEDVVEEDVGLDDGGVSSASQDVPHGHSQSSSTSSSAFSHTHVHAYSTSSNLGSTASSSGLDTDPPLTLLSNARFVIAAPPVAKGARDPYPSSRATMARIS